jgi:hypothetical protein
MSAEKRTPFDEGQLFSERTQIFVIFALKSEFRFQPEIEVPANKSVWHAGGSRIG